MNIDLPKAAPSGQMQLSDAQKKLIDEDQAQTLAAQENMKISGSNARHMVMQKLMRENEQNVRKAKHSSDVVL